MLTFAIVVFFISLIGIVALFGVKFWEERHESVFAQPMRQKADEHAIKLKELLLQSRVEAAKLPPKAVHVTRILVHIAALQAAHLARVLEAQAHRLADFVSHKHHFEKRETQSEFLKQVSEHPMRNRNGSNPGTTQAATGHGGAGKNGLNGQNGGNSTEKLD